MGVAVVFAGMLCVDQCCEGIYAFDRLQLCNVGKLRQQLLAPVQEGHLKRKKCELSNVILWGINGMVLIYV